MVTVEPSTVTSTGPSSRTYTGEDRDAMRAVTTSTRSLNGSRAGDGGNGGNVPASPSMTR